MERLRVPVGRHPAAPGAPRDGHCSVTHRGSGARRFSGPAVLSPAALLLPAL